MRILKKIVRIWILEILNIIYKKMEKISNGLYLVKMLPNSKMQNSDILKSIFPNLDFSESKKLVELYSKNQIFVLTDLYRICKSAYTNGLVKFFESNIVIGLYETECEYEHFNIMLKFATANIIISKYPASFWKCRLSVNVNLSELENRFEPVLPEFDENFESLFYKPRQIRKIKKCK
jgi:hypothetical protein